MRELDLALMSNKERLHVGFPESGYAKYAERLVRLGMAGGLFFFCSSPGNPTSTSAFLRELHVARLFGGARDQVCGLLSLPQLHFLGGASSFCVFFWLGGGMVPGYKVGRVEQVETVTAQKARVESKATSRSADDKVVKRDMCGMLTQGTLCDADLIGNQSLSIALFCTFDLPLLPSRSTLVCSFC